MPKANATSAKGSPSSRSAACVTTGSVNPAGASIGPAGSKLSNNSLAGAQRDAVARLQHQRHLETTTVILIDPRESETRKLTPHIRQLGRPCDDTTYLTSGDFSFLGHGPQSPWRVGIERKGILDLCGSMDSGRLTGSQLPRLHEDYDVVYLLVEGAMRRVGRGPKEGDLEYRYFDRDWTSPVKPVNYFAVCNFLTTLEAKAGLNLRFAFTPYDSATQVVALYDWWTTKTWEQHRAHLGVYTTKRGEVRTKDEAIVRMLTSLKIGVSEKIARRAAVAFGTPERMVSAPEAHWGKVEGVGVKLATKLVAIFKGKKQEITRK